MPQIEITITEINLPETQIALARKLARNYPIRIAKCTIDGVAYSLTQYRIGDFQFKKESSANGNMTNHLAASKALRDAMKQFVI